MAKNFAATNNKDLAADWKEVIMGSQNRERSDGMASKHDVAVPPAPGPMARQFDLSYGNQATPQIMLQLVGCRVENRPPSDSRDDRS